jgi:hypothetical protein
VNEGLLGRNWHQMLKDEGGDGDVPSLENQSGNANNGDQTPESSANMSTALVHPYSIC